MSLTVHHTGPGEGIPLAMIDGIHTVKAGAEHTGGVCEVFEVDAVRGPAAPPHRSPWAVTCYLLHGTVRVEFADQTHQLTPGASLTIPANTAYTFVVTSDSAKFLAVTTGSGAGKFFADMAEHMPRDRPLEELMPLLIEITQRHGVSFAAPAGPAATDA